MTAAVAKSQQAYDLLHVRISRGDLLPGQRVVLGHVADELGSSVVPVREALRRLEAEGLVTFERNIGARVTELDEDEYLETMQTLSVVEGAAVAMGAPRLTDEDIAAARELNQELDELLEHFEPEHFTSLNERFHRTLSDACPNTHLLDLVDRGWKRLGRVRRSTFTYVPDRARESVAEHAHILDLIQNGADPLEVELAVRHHRLATPHALVERTRTPSQTRPIVTPSPEQPQPLREGES